MIFVRLLALLLLLLLNEAFLYQWSHKLWFFGDIRFNDHLAHANPFEHLDLLLPLPLGTANDYHSRGNKRLAIGWDEGALSDFNEAIKLDGKRATFYASRATAYSHLGKPVEALQDINQAIDLDKHSSDFYATRASIRVDSGGDLGMAMFDASRAITLNPGNALAYLVRTNVEVKSNQVEAAISDLAQAATLSKEPLVYEKVGQMYALRGNGQQAVYYFQTAADLYKKAGKDYLAQSVQLELEAAQHMVTQQAAQEQIRAVQEQSRQQLIDLQQIINSQK